MKEKVAIRCIIGAPIGLALSTIISIAISLTVGMDAFTRLFPNELQTAGRKLMQFCCRQSAHYYMARHGQVLRLFWMRIIGVFFAKQ